MGAIMYLPKEFEFVSEELKNDRELVLFVISNEIYDNEI